MSAPLFPAQAPIATIPAEEILRAGQAVPFQICSLTAGWERPDLDEMQPVFTNPRFGDGSKPWPRNYAYYLSDFSYRRFPTANSANAELNAFSGFWSRGDAATTEQRCDYQALSQGAVGDARAFQSLDVIGRDVLAIRRLEDYLAVLVGSGTQPDVYRNVVFPYPPSSGFFDAPVQSVQVVDTHGVKLYEERGNAGAWYEQAQYDGSGQLEFLVVGGSPPVRSTEITIKPGARLLKLFGGQSGGLTLAGTVTVLDEQGAEVTKVSWAPQTELWQPLASLDLLSGTYRLRFEAPGQTHRFLILTRDDLALP
ncbi:MAG: hypothetical protein GEU75_10540 [Dehalococcoidia bacterium]|nr:hypothetical protein [Dehalococcoidia bacterium]